MQVLTVEHWAIDTTDPSFNYFSFFLFGIADCANTGIISIFPAQTAVMGVLIRPLVGTELTRSQSKLLKLTPPAQDPGDNNDNNNSH